ncbi:MAG: thioredoxin family protein [Rikenellaceae bacterium]
MKKVQLFIQARCPFCVKALRYIEDAKQQNEELKGIEIEIHDEILEPDFADTFDYYYVPTLFIDGEKVHEGAIYEDEIVPLLKRAL